MKKFFTWFSIAVIFMFAIYTAISMGELGSTYSGIGEIIIKETVEKTAAMNAVTAVVFDFRGYDTLGESFVLFTAITASIAILRKPVKARTFKKGGK